VFWPVLWYFKIGVITGPKSWFWIIGELNYPFAFIMFYWADSFLVKIFKDPRMVFISGMLMVACVMPFFYQWAGFRMAVLMEAFLF